MLQTNISKRVHDTYAWQWKNGMQRVCSVPLFKGPIWERAKKFLVIIPKVVISLLMVSRGIILFEEHIATVGTTSNNMLSKRKTLDEGSL